MLEHTLQSTIRNLKAVCTAVLARDAIDEAGMKALEGTIAEVSRLLKQHREMEASAKVEAGKK